MASGYTMIPTSTEGQAKMAKSGNSGAFKSKPAGKQAVKGGGSGKMQKFSGSGPQAPDSTAQTKHAGKGAPFPKGGPSGKMAKFKAVKTQKPGQSGQS
jgi:hypothetical protein